MTDGYVEYEGIVSLPKRSYRLHNVLYNYYVEIGGKEELKEFVLNHGNTHFENRSLCNRLLGKKGTCKT